MHIYQNEIKLKIIMFSGLCAYRDLKCLLRRNTYDKIL